MNKQVIVEKIKKNRFLFEELVKRDFKKKYKRAALGMIWSMLAPLMTLLVMSMVFTTFFGRNIPHYIIYLFSGNLIFNYFREATSSGMTSLTANASIFVKVNVPKYLFLLSKNVSTIINFLLTLIIYFVFIAIDDLSFTWKFLMLLYPIGCLFIFNIGLGLILSALFVFFKDVQYLYDVFTMMLMYFSAIFYNIDVFSARTQYFFYLNPIYVYISYFRKIVIESTVPSLSFHLLSAFYAVVTLLIGAAIYKKYNYKFLYYV